MSLPGNVESFKFHIMVRLVFSFFMCFLFVSGGYAQQTKLFNDNWEFIKDIDTAVTANLFNKNNQLHWSKISLPHTAAIEPIEKVAQQWQGTCNRTQGY